MIRLSLILLFLSHLCLAQRSDFGSVNFHRADSIASKYRKSDLKSLPVLAHQLTSNLSTDVEKFRSIYRWVCSNISYDYSTFVKNDIKRKKLKGDSAALSQWNSTLLARLYSRLLKHRKTVCTGYAYLVKELANLVDLECEIVDGYGRNINTNVKVLGMPNHSWNKVKLNGKWYLCDPTWSSGYTINGSFIHAYNDGYFLAHPETFAMNHHPLDKTSMLIKNKQNIDEFINAPIIYQGAFEHRVQSVYPKKLDISLHKATDFTVKIQSLKTLDESMLTFELVKSRNKSTVKPKIEAVDNDTYTMTHKFTGLGEYDVHLKYGNTYLATYVVDVKRQRKIH